MSRSAGDGQLDLFAATPVTEPALVAGPARPLATPATVPAGRVLEPMSSAAVAWIEQHVIADFHLANEDIWWCGPAQDWEADCVCQFPCSCRSGHHDRCRALHARGGYLTAPKPETHLRHPLPNRPGRPAPFTAVWLADRSCRPLCSCTTCGTTPTTVVCLKGRQGDPLLDSDRFVYVGRPLFTGGWRLHGHVLANPYKVTKQVTAAQAVASYEAWLAKRPAALLARELPRLKGKVLGCWCAEGQPCHARVLAKAADAYDADGEGAR